MSECIDREIGDLLLGYELGMLSKEEAERFEDHLLACQHCYDELRGFEREAALLAGNSEIRTDFVRSFRKEAGPRSLLSSLRTYLWPRMPLPFRPAIAYALILLMAIPAYHGLRMADRTRVFSAPTVVLTAVRSNDNAVLRADDQPYGLVEVILEDAVSDKSYEVVVEFVESGEIILTGNLDHFDHNGVDRLWLPLEALRSGLYRLTVIDTEATPSRNRWEYDFTVLR
jgi:hypothetical protein